MNLWPIRPKPKQDELLSSWLCRIAEENQMQTSAFCSAVFLGERFTFREIDRTFGFEMMTNLSLGTGIPIDRIWEASLLSDSGYVFDFRPVGTTEWIFPTASADGESGNGLAYCPLCLEDDPYYRRSWRFAFNPACAKHRVFLMRDCPSCRKPYNYYYGITEIPAGAPLIVTCRWCGADIRNAAPDHADSGLIDGVLKVQEFLNEGIAQDFFSIPDYGHVHARSYLTVYRACMVSLVEEAKAKWVLINQAGNLPAGIDLSALKRGVASNMLEYRPMEGIATLMCLGDILMQEWPHRFLRYAKRNRITPTEFFVSTDIVPYWVTQSAKEFFPKRPSPPCRQERQNAQKLLRSKLSRPESPGELKIYMQEGLVLDLYRPSKKPIGDEIPPPSRFRLEPYDPNKNVKKIRDKWGKTLYSLTADQLAKIAVLRQRGSKGSVPQPAQMHLFDPDSPTDSGEYLSVPEAQSVETT